MPILRFILLGSQKTPFMRNRDKDAFLRHVTQLLKIKILERLKTLEKLIKSNAHSISWVKIVLFTLCSHRGTKQLVCALRD